MSEDEFQFRMDTNYFSFSLEALGEISAAGPLALGLPGGRGVSTGDGAGDALLYAVDPLAGAGGRLCLNQMKATEEDNETLVYSGLGSSLCASAYYNYDGGYQYRTAFRVTPFLNDGQFRIPIGLDYVYRHIPEGSVTAEDEAATQHAGFLSVGLQYYFRTLDEGAGVNPFVGGEFSIGGVGGNDFGGVGLGLVGGAGLEFFSPF